MTLPMDVEGPGAPPRSNGELVFAAPWESRAFAMAVALSEAGVFSWRQFQAALIARIARQHNTSTDWCYYEHWLGALEDVLASRAAVAARRARSRTAMTTAVRPILVTGATGRIGGTGRHVAAELLKRGLPVRALVRRLDERSEALQAMGIQITVGDFADYASLLAALEDIEAAYFSYPVGAGLTEAAGLFAAAGRQRDLQLVVDLSLDAAFPESPSPQGRAEWVAERIFEWAGYHGAHLRVAAFFMENLLALYRRPVREHGHIRNSFGDFEPSWIAGSDVGAIGAARLANPALITDRTTVVGGGQQASHTTIAAIITKATGHPVRYQVLTPGMARRTDRERHGRRPIRSDNCCPPVRPKRGPAWTQHPPGYR